MKFAADFETTTIEEDCRVWAWALSEIGNPEHVEIGTDLDMFFMYLRTLGKKNHKLWFHNLKFDGEFIIHWLLTNGFKWVENKKEAETGTFTTTIGEMGQFYTIDIYFYKAATRTEKISIYDSLKLIPFKVEKIAKDFGLPIRKLELDYKEYRAPDHVLTPHERDYIKNDVVIMAMALEKMFELGLTKMTIGSNAMAFYKKQIGEGRFKHIFPTPEYDAEVRKSYRGGWTYCNPTHQGKDLDGGIVLDVNSLYPARMRHCPMPMGEGVAFNGKYKYDNRYPLYVQRLTCIFDLKPGYLPTIQLKGGLFGSVAEYASNSDGRPISLTLTSVDLDLFIEHYNVEVLEWEGGWKWMQSTSLFNKYIDYWMEKKITAEQEGNGCMRAIAKLMLNNLYGKFSTNPVTKSKRPVLAEDGHIQYILMPAGEREAVYIPVGTFITAWARDLTIRSAQAVYDRFAYADTDSLHLVGTDIPVGLEIHDTKLGAWKLEREFTRARFIRPKCNIEHDRKTNKLMVTCAGMPANCKESVTWENFQPGAKYEGKLVPKHVPGGIVLRETEFTLRC